MPLSTSGPGSAAGAIGGYTLVERLGSGGMGVVHLARSASGRQVAVKVVHAQYAQDEEFRARFRQEVVAARRVSGAFTAPVVDADPDAEVPWMATLYVPGRTLADLVSGEGPLGGRELRVLALGLTEALRDIHQAGVVHRDLKPSNVLMAEDGPRVIDFGISRAADSQVLTVTGRLMGTPPFMSPEQFVSPRDVTAASDIFSLGSLLAYAATGNRPFDGESPYLTGYQVMNERPDLSGVPQPLHGIVERCLAKEPAGRPELAELYTLFTTLPDAPAAPPELPATAKSPATKANRPGAIGPYDTTHDGGAAAVANIAGAYADGTSDDGDGHDTGTLGNVRSSKPIWRRRLPALALTAALTLSAAAGVAWWAESNYGSANTSSTAQKAPVPVLPANWHPWRANLTQPVEPVDSNRLVSNSESGCLADTGGGSSSTGNGNGTSAAPSTGSSAPDGTVGTANSTGTGTAAAKTPPTALYCAGTGFTVAKLDPATGRTLWRSGVSPQTARPVGIRDGVLYIYEKPNSDTLRWQLLALDAGTGKRLWAQEIEEVEPAVVFSGGALAVSPGDTQLIAFSPEGKTLWTTKSASTSGTHCTPLALGGAPYGLCARAEDPTKGNWSLLRLDPADGTPHELAALPNGAVPLGVVGGKLQFAVPQPSESGFTDQLDAPYTALLKVDPATGAVTRAPLKETPRGTVTLIGTAVYFVRPDGTVTAYNAADGTKVWEEDTQVENLSKPALTTTYGKLIFVNRYGRVVALDRVDGYVDWTTDKLENPGSSPESTTPRALLAGDALVGVAGDTAFSIRGDGTTIDEPLVPAPTK